MNNILYTPAREAKGSLIFVSGQVPVDSQGNPVAGGVREQLVAVFERMSEVLASQGCALEDVVKLTHFITDMNDLAEVRKAILETFAEPRPASSLVQVAGLINPAFRIEIEAIAVRQAEA